MLALPSDQAIADYPQLIVQLKACLRSHFNKNEQKHKVKNDPKHAQCYHQLYGLSSKYMRIFPQNLRHES